MSRGESVEWGIGLSVKGESIEVESVESVKSESIVKSESVEDKSVEGKSVESESVEGVRVRLPGGESHFLTVENSRTKVLPLRSARFNL